MRKLILALGAVAMTTPAVLVPVTPASAQRDDRRYSDQYARDHGYREWRGNDGRYRCRRTDGTIGTVVGGVGGALLGNALLGGTAGTLVGAAGGALGGRAIQRDRQKHSCR